MKIGFYYHIPIFANAEGIFIPSFLGVFLDSLAGESEHLFLIMHRSNKAEMTNCNYKLKAQNVTFIDLGLKTPAWHRAIFHKKLLKEKLAKLVDCDAFLVRSPSPLSPYFHKYYKGKNLYFMVVGDYIKSGGHLKKNSSFRDKIVFKFLEYNSVLFTKRIKKTPILVNSVELFETYKNIAPSVHLIKTTTLSESDFLVLEDTCQADKIALVFTGRIDPAKGLFELLEAISILTGQNYHLDLHIAGWEPDDVNKPVQHRMIESAKELGISERIHFHGRKSVGPELNEIYRMGDIYVLPSYHEGFPRTIWEAMANSLPVIATTVGGIPTYLKHEETAFLIEHKKVDVIVDAIKIVIEDGDLRRKLINSGRKLAATNTLEIQTKNMLNIIQNNSTHE